MTKKLPLLITLLFCLNFYSQITFEKGYFINNNDEKVECLIKNLDWLNTPTSFKYKLLENSDEKTITIKDVKEFGIHDFSKFERYTVNIEKSRDNTTADLTQNRNPLFVKETLFLKLLISGSANLYSYEKNSVYKFFYTSNNNNTPKQLIYKRYYINRSTIKKNNRFHQQLSKDVKCETISNKEIQRLDYKTKELTNYFASYNKCVNPKFTEIVSKKDEKIISLNLKAGASYASTTNKTYTQTSFNNEDDSQGLGLKIGLEAEFNLNFNKNKWAIFIEPNYTTFNLDKYTKRSKPFFDQPTPFYTLKTEYNKLDIPLGIRHYMFLNSDSKLFINASYSIFTTGKTTISYIIADETRNTATRDHKTNGFSSVGMGYSLKNKYTIELRYENQKSLNYDNDTVGFKNNIVSVIFGYTLF